MTQGSLPSQQDMEVDLRRQLNDVFGEFDDFAGLVSKQIFGVIPTSGVMRGFTPYSANRLPSNALLPSASHCLQEMKNVAPLLPPLQVNRNDIENAGCASEASSSQCHMNDDENSIRRNKRKREQNDEDGDGHVKRREHKEENNYIRDLFDDDNEDEKEEREWPRQDIKTLLDKMKVLPLLPPIEDDKRIVKKEEDDEKEEGERKKRKEKDELERWKKDRNGDEERKHKKDGDEEKTKKRDEEEDKRRKREEERRRREEDEKKRKREDEEKEKEKEKKKRRKEESEREEEERRIRKEKKKREKEDGRRKEEEEEKEKEKEKERQRKVEEREKQKKEEEAERKRLQDEELKRQKEIREQEMARKVEEERREAERVRIEEEEKKKKETERYIREEEIRKKEAEEKRKKDADDRKRKEEEDRLKKEKKKEEEKKRKKEEEKEKRKKEEYEKAKKDKEKDKEIGKKGSLPLNGLSLSKFELLKEKEKEKERKKRDHALNDSKDDHIGSIALLNEKKKNWKEEKPKEKRMKDVERIVKKEISSARSSPISSKNSSRVATPIPSQYLPSTSTHHHVGSSFVSSPSSDVLSFPHCPSSICMAARFIPTAPSHLEQRPDFENYTLYAKEKKHKGDASTDKVIRYLNYIESSVYFALSVSTFPPSKWGDKELNTASYVLKDTIDLVKHALVLIEKDGNTHMTSRAKILCIRIQSILNYHLYFFKSSKIPRRGDTLASLESQVQEVVRDSPKKEEKKSAEKADRGDRGGPSVTPSPSPSSIAPNSNMVSMPMSLWKMKTTQVSTYGHLESAHILWNESIKMITWNEKHYFNIMDNLILQSFDWGCPLHVGSSLLHLSHFTNTVLTWLRQEYEAEKRKAE